MPAMLRAMPGVLLVAIGTLSMAGTPAQAAKSACEKSASEMRNSCNFELREEFHATLANCKQLEDPEDCNDEAREERWEAVGLCREQYHARVDACELLDEDYYADPLLDSIDFIDPDEIPDGYDPNPYVIIQAGHTYVLRAGEDGEELVVVHVTDEVREIQDVLCRVVVDIVVEVGEDEEDGGVDYIPIEVTDDWFAQAKNGDVYYCGEIARNYEDGVLRDLDGSFESGLDYAKAGLLVAARPKAGVAHRQEYALGEAEDIVQYVGKRGDPADEDAADNEAFPCDGRCLQTYDFSPLEPDASEFKYYVKGLGFVLALALEDGEPTGEREELVCVGDSLDVLSSEACDIDDPDELLDELCELHPEGICEDPNDDD